MWADDSSDLDVLTPRPPRAPARLRSVPAAAGMDVTPEFITFYRTQYPGAVRLAALLTGSDAASEDLVQDVFVRLAARFGSLDAPAAYLRTSVLNAVRQWHRDGARRSRKLVLLRPEAWTADDHGEAEMADAIAALPFRQRVVIVGRYWAGWTEREIADALGCRPGTVKSLASRALATLRRGLEGSDQ